MNHLRQKLFGVMAILVMTAAAMAQKKSIQLPRDSPSAQIKSGAGEEVARKNCGFCHSTDYIVIQPHLTAQQWDAEVKKMIAVYGAPISVADAKTISDYLAKNYSDLTSRIEQSKTR
jgi:sulfite dehydrogenase (cytochrome) subunit B